MPRATDRVSVRRRAALVPNHELDLCVWNVLLDSLALTARPARDLYAPLQDRAMDVQGTEHALGAARLVEMGPASV
jgi:hypothetical protein